MFRITYSTIDGKTKSEGKMTFYDSPLLNEEQIKSFFAARHPNRNIVAIEMLSPKKIEELPNRKGRN